MPTYAYECAACGHKLEEFQTMSAAPIRKCPACKKQKLQRLIGAGAGVIFKGSGFYQTDYKKSGSGEPKKDADGAPKSDTTTPKKADTEPTKPAPTTAGDSKDAKKASKPADQK